MANFACRPTHIVRGQVSQGRMIGRVCRSSKGLEDEVTVLGRHPRSLSATLVCDFLGSGARCGSGTEVHHKRIDLDNPLPAQGAMSSKSARFTVEPLSAAQGVPSDAVPNVQQFRVSVKEVPQFSGVRSGNRAAHTTSRPECIPSSSNTRKRGHRCRRRRQNRRDKHELSSEFGGKAPPSVQSEILFSSPPTSGSPTKRDLILHVESVTCPTVTTAASATNSGFTTFNPTLAFILGGNEDLSDADGDWDEVHSRDEDCGSDLPVDIFFGMFSVSVVAGEEIRSPDEGFPDVMHSPALLREVNSRWRESYAGVRTGHRNSKVHFAADGSLVETHKADDIDRKGIWEQAASDRLRFQCRISAADKVLSPILSAEHRQRVLQRMTVSSQHTGSKKTVPSTSSTV